MLVGLFVFGLVASTMRIAVIIVKANGLIASHDTHRLRTSVNRILVLHRGEIAFDSGEAQKGGNLDEAFVCQHVRRRRQGACVVSRFAAVTLGHLFVPLTLVA